MDIIIKDCPSGAEADVKKLAAVAVERFLKKSLIVPKADVSTFEGSVNSFLVANEMDKKYKVELEVEEIAEK